MYQSSPPLTSLPRTDATWGYSSAPPTDLREVICQKKSCAHP